MRALLWAVISVCFLTASVEDCRTCEVHNLLWWISGTAAALLIVQNGISRALLLELTVFCLLQLILFSRMYGRADCYAFCVCAAAEASLGAGLQEYLVHMLFAFGILAVIQLFRHNVNRKGNLKQAVPFLPYITVSFGLFFLIFSGF